MTGMGARRWVLWLEGAWDGARPRLDLRIEAYGGHGGPQGVVGRGRVLDDPTPTDPVEGEGVLDATLRTLRRFLTDELPGVPLRVTVGDARVDTVTDAEGYFQVRLPAGGLTSPWTTGTVEL